MLEHLVCSNVMAQFEEHNILNDRQHGFGKTHSCETQLVSIIHDWATSLEKRKQVDKFILDFEKAFDTVPRELLKSELHRYGIQHNILNWIDSDREQCVVVNGSKSKHQKYSLVFHRAILGPILFLIHINKFPKM